MAMVKDIAQI